MESQLYENDENKLSIHTGWLGPFLLDFNHETHQDLRQHRLQSDGPWAVSSSARVFVNNVLPKLSHDHLLTHFHKAAEMPLKEWTALKA